MSARLPSPRLHPLALALSLTLCVLSSVQAQNLSFSDASQAQTATTHPLSLDRSWFGPQAHSGTFRNNQVLVQGNFDQYDAIAAWSDNQNLADNSLTLASGSKAYLVTAAAAQRTTAAYNETTLEANSKVYAAFGAVAQQSGLTRVNSITSFGQSEFLAGGISLDGVADSNEAFLEAGAVSTFAAGGYGGRGASNNELSVADGAHAESAYGGLSSAGRADANFVSINGRVKQAIGGDGAMGADSNFLDIYADVESAVGGLSTQGESRYNTVTLWAGSAQSLVGGYSELGTAANGVTVSAGATAHHVQGGSSVSGDSIDNTIAIYGTVDASTDTTTIPAVIGGQSEQGNSYLNQVIIDANATVKGEVIAGLSHNEAAYNNLTIDGQVTGDVIAGISCQGSSRLNLLTIRNTTLNGRAIGAVGQETANNTLLVHNATIHGNAIGAIGDSATHNLTILRGNTTIDGIVYGAMNQAGQALNEHNEISVDGSVKVQVLDGFSRLHIFLEPQNEADSPEENAQHVLTVSGEQGLDLSGRELWVSGLHLDHPEAVKLIYVNAANKLTVDEKTVIYGDSTFVFHSWQPKDEHHFLHELIWTEDGPTSTPDDSQSGSGDDGSENPLPPSDEIFDHHTQVKTAAEQTLLSAPAAAALTLAQGSSLLSTLSLTTQDTPATRCQLAPFAAVRAYSADFAHVGTLELDGAAMVAGVAFPLTEDGLWRGAIFAEGGGASYEHDFGAVEPSGDVSYGGLGAQLGFAYNHFASSLTLRAGWMQSDFEAYYTDTADMVRTDYDAPYLAFGLEGAYNLHLNSNFVLSPQISYFMHYLSGDTLTLEHRDRNELKIDDIYLQSLRTSLQGRLLLNDSWELYGDIYWRRIFSSNLSGEVEHFAVPSFELNGDSYGINVGAQLNLENVTWSLTLRQSVGDLDETAGQLQFICKF